MSAQDNLRPEQFGRWTEKQTRGMAALARINAATGKKAPPPVKPSKKDIIGPGF